MNYGKNEVEKTLRKTNSRSQKITSHLVLLLTKIILILVLFAAVLGISFGYGIFKGVIDAAPEIDVASIIAGTPTARTGTRISFLGRIYLMPS